MPDSSAEASKWGAIGAAACFLIFAVLVGILFSNGTVCSASYGDETSIGACPDQKPIGERVRAVSSEDEIRLLASAIAANNEMSVAVATEINQKFPAEMRQIVGVVSETRDENLFSLNDRSLILRLDSEFEELSQKEGQDRFAAMNQAIEQIPLWTALRQDAKRRGTIFRPIADEFTATQPYQTPDDCQIRTKSDGPFADGEFVYLESEDGTSRIVREAVSDPMDGASYQFHLNAEDAHQLRLTKARQTRGIVFARPAERQERDDLYRPCIDAASVEARP